MVADSLRSVDDDIERPGCAAPSLLVIAVVVLVVIGLFTIIGWALSLAWAVVRLVLIVIVVAGLATAVRAVMNNR